MGLTIIGFDGFEWCTAAYPTSIRGDLWASSAGAPVAGRFGGQAANMNNGLTSIPLPITNTLAVHWALAVGPGNVATLDFRDSANISQFALSVNNATRRMELKRGATVVATGTHTYAIGIWFSVQVHFYLNDTVGRCIVKVEGVTDLDFTGDTKNTALANISIISFGGGSGCWVDDVAFYLPDAVGVDWMQDSKVTAKNPNGAGALTSWALTGAATNHAAQATTDGDTSYVSSSTPGDIDTYAMSAAAPLGQVYAVNVGLIARKDDAATRQIRHILRIAAVNYAGPTKTLASGYLNYTDLLTTSPATAAPWTLAGVDAIEAGLEEVA